MTEEAPLPTTPEMLMEILKTMGIPYVLHQHIAVFTCEESDFLKNEIPGLHVKNLFIRDKKERTALVVLPTDMGLDLKAVAPEIGLDRISFGSPERLWQYLGVRPGSVCPFSAMNDREGKVQVILHEAVAKADIMCAHPMLNTMTLQVSGPDLVLFLKEHGNPPKIMDLSAYGRPEAA